MPVLSPRAALHDSDCSSPHWRMRHWQTHTKGTATATPATACIGHNSPHSAHLAHTARQAAHTAYRREKKEVETRPI